MSNTTVSGSRSPSLAQASIQAQSDAARSISAFDQDGDRVLSVSELLDARSDVFEHDGEPGISRDDLMTTWLDAHQKTPNSPALLALGQQIAEHRAAYLEVQADNEAGRDKQRYIVGGAAFAGACVFTLLGFVVPALWLVWPLLGAAVGFFVAKQIPLTPSADEQAESDQKLLELMRQERALMEAWHQVAEVSRPTPVTSVKLPAPTSTASASFSAGRSNAV